MGKVFSKVLAAGSAVVAFTLMAAPVMAQSYYDYGYTPADTAAATGIFAVTSFLPLLCCCVMYLVFIGIGIWVYKDAKKHNIDNAAVWAILCVFFTVIGLLIYFLVPRAEAMKKMEGSNKKPE